MENILVCVLVSEVISCCRGNGQFEYHFSCVLSKLKLRFLTVVVE